jgi:hypothetical protein
VRNSFASVRAIVDHQTIAVFIETELARDLRGFQEQMAEDSLIFRRSFVDARNRFARNDQNMRRRGRANVAKREDLIILINDVSRNLPISNLLKQRLAHGARIISRVIMKITFRAFARAMNLGVSLGAR